MSPSDRRAPRGARAFPDLDLRQRLTLKSGYGVVELSRGKAPSSRSALSGISFRDREVQVLSIGRGGQVFPNPRGDLGDRGRRSSALFRQLRALRQLLGPEPARGSSPGEDAAYRGSAMRPADHPGVSSACLRPKVARARARSCSIAMAAFGITASAWGTPAWRARSLPGSIDTRTTAASS